ncbi:MAG: MBL fold metallo-hydrolase [Methanoregula sp.]|nr:MBL fold metallo-hydrolase [Methanoregula sp.]
MPAGNDQLASLLWQPLPGAPAALIYPLIRKIDTISSNSYLIQTPDAILLIDPGGIPEQAEQLMQVVTEVRGEKERPVYVILTHAHIDHFCGIQNIPAFAYADTTVLMVQDTGASALERGDCGMTQADLMNTTISPMRVGHHILTQDLKDHHSIPVEICLANGGLLTVTVSPADPLSLLPDRETIVFGPKTSIECYHTPGHSPDSICIRIGGLLFIGDILFAANPGVAGLVGWSQEALIRSLSGIGTLLSREDIVTVCPGHGRLIPAGDAAKTLMAVKKDALALANIAELNRDRAVQAAAYAEDCMEEVNELFTIMAGRLYYVSFVLEELGESEIATEMNTLINGDTIDEILDTFRIFAEEHHRGGGVSIHIALKAGQVVAKLQRTFNKDELAHIIDPSLVNRAGRLLSDYTTMFRGFTPPKEITVVNLPILIEMLVAGLSISSCSDDDMMSSVDDEKAFARMLLARIGTRPLLEDVNFTMKGIPEPIMVAIDRDHFTDLLTYILEDLVGTGSDTIHLCITKNDPDVNITISGNVPPAGDDGNRKNLRFLSGLTERTGGCLSCGRDETTGMRSYTIIVTSII